MNVLDSSNGRLSLSKEYVEHFKEVISKKAELEAEEKEMRATIFQAMEANDIGKTEVGGLTFSIVQSKPIEEFDTDGFLLNEDEHMTSVFTSFDKEETFDLERFKQEQPEIYNQYVVINNTPIVDTKKLKDMLPNIYKKYVVLRDSNRKDYLKVNAKK